MWWLVPWIAVGGALGAVARFVLTAAVTRVAGPELPWGTLLVNVIGSLLLGILFAASDRVLLSAGTRAMLTTGVMGALTTFSTFSVETMRLAQRGDLAWAAGNVFANVLLSLAAAAVGMAVATRLSGSAS